MCVGAQHVVVSAPGSGQMDPLFAREGFIFVPDWDRKLFSVVFGGCMEYMLLLVKWVWMCFRSDVLRGAGEVCCRSWNSSGLGFSTCSCLVGGRR